MRQRKAKKLPERLEAVSDLMVEEGAGWKGKWRALFGNESGVYLELGCGKGQFSIAQAKKHPERNYIAVEGQISVILRAMEKAKEAGVENIRFLNAYIHNMAEYFEEGELSGIYLNFSDPWPKERHAKRRLTHRNYLEGYEIAVEKGGCVEFKTDNDGLFEFSLEEIKEKGYPVLECSRDVHHSAFSAKSITTEYEDKFREAGKNINYVKFSFESAC